MRAEYGEAQQEAVEAEEHPHEKLMTAARNGLSWCSASPSWS